MRYRIPADPRRNAVRTRAQSTLFRRAIPRTMSRTRRALLLRNPLAMPRTIRSTSAAQSVRNVEHNSQHCRAQPAALLLRSLCAMRRTVRRSSAVQSVRNAAHNPLPNAAPQVVQSDADATCLHPRVVRTAISRNAAAKRKTASGVRDQENNMETSAERLQLHSDTRVASCGG
jgi:hypothetical protein